MSPEELLRSKLKGVRKTGPDTFVACCPGHDDSSASLSVKVVHDRVLVHCFAGCSCQSLLAAIGLQTHDLLMPSMALARAARRAASDDSSAISGLSLEELAAAKSLPVDVLRQAGWHNCRYQKRPAVAIPYERRDGSKERTQYRVALSGDRFRFGRAGTGNIIAYEPDRGVAALALHYLVIAEGATDGIAGMIAGLPMLCLPGAKQVKTILAEHLVGIEKVYCCREPDAGGDALMQALPARLAALGFTGALHEVHLPGAKDLCELHAKDPTDFATLAKTAIESATSIDVAPLARVTTATIAVSGASAKKHRDAWMAGLIVDKEGHRTRCLANVLQVLAMHPAWQGVIARDAFRESIEKLAPPPVREQDGTSTTGPWTEGDSARTAAWFASEVFFEPTIRQIDTAVATIAEKTEIHEVRDYLKSLVWDQKPRLEGMFATYFGARATVYTRAISARWMISSVARALRPGCQVDCLPVLEGPQGSGKSTGLEALFGQRLFSDTPPNIGDKDAYQGLRGKHCIEFGELDAIKGREASKVKNFVSARSDNYRPSYGHRSSDHPRQCVFCATTNEREYLVDRTGNRRFWPVRCYGKVDVDGLRRDRDQLFAEARVCFDRGDPWHVNTPELRDLCEREQRQREIEDAWFAPIEEYLTPKNLGRRGRLASEGVTAYDVMTHALHLRAQDMNQSASTKVGMILHRLGWTWSQLREGGERVRRYFPRASQPVEEAGCDGDTQSNEAHSAVSHPSQPKINLSSNSYTETVHGTCMSDAAVAPPSPRPGFWAVTGVTPSGSELPSAGDAPANTNGDDGSDHDAGDHDDLAFEIDDAAVAQ